MYVGRIHLAFTVLHWSTQAAAGSPSRFTLYDLPKPESGQCDICEGPDGNVWIQNFLVDTIVRLKPTTGERTEFQIPYKNLPSPTSVLPGVGNRTALACAIRPGEDGNIYAASGVWNEIVVVYLATDEVKTYAQPLNDPLGNVFPFNDMWKGPSGMLFSQVTGNTVSLFDYKS